MRSGVRRESKYECITIIPVGRRTQRSDVCLDRRTGGAVDRADRLRQTWTTDMTHVTVAVSPPLTWPKVGDPAWGDPDNTIKYNLCQCL